MFYFNRYFNIFINKICGILLVVVLILLAFFLGVYKASAARAENWREDVLTPTIAFGANCTSSGCSNSGVTTNAGYLTYDEGYVHTYYYTNDIYTAKNGFGMMWVFNTTNSFKTGYLYSIRAYVCNFSSAAYTAIDISTGNNAGNTYAYTNKPLYSSSVATNTIASVTGDGESCSYMTYYVVPSIDSQYIGVQFTTNTSVTTQQYLEGYTYDSLGLYTPELRNEIDNAIKDSNLATAEDIDKLNEEVKEMTSEQQQTNNKLDDLNNNITSENTSGGESEGSSFFNDFEVNDNGGISGIITSPLKVINKMLESNTCENLSFTLNFLGKSKQVSLPSGCIMWNKAPQSAVTIYQTLLCGLFSYILATNLFKDIEKLKNPKESEVDTLDL